MTDHRHRFSEVQDYLHHRKPYLMVDKVVAIHEEAIETSKLFTGEESFAFGHFPGAPIFPGAMMQELTTQSAGVLIAANFNPMTDFDTSDPFHNEFALGVLTKVKMSKFKGFARPGDRLIATVKLSERVGQVFEFEGKIHCGDRLVMKNSFQLMNIKSTVLQGVAESV